MNRALAIVLVLAAVTLAVAPAHAAEEALFRVRLRCTWQDDSGAARGAREVGFTSRGTHAYEAAGCRFDVAVSLEGDAVRVTHASASGTATLLVRRGCPPPVFRTRVGSLLVTTRLESLQVAREAGSEASPACRACDGHGRCHICQGHGGTACNLCWGSGHCAACSGSGACPSCHDRDSRSCGVCGGSGKCGSCHASRDCSGCAGKGQLACSICRGSGACQACPGRDQ